MSETTTGTAGATAAAAAPAAPAAPAPAGMTGKQFTLNILNGLALGVVLALIPGAILGEISKAVFPHAHWLQMVIEATTMAQACMGLIVGFVICQMFKLSPIQSAAVAMATQYAAGAVVFGGKPGNPTMMLKGTGDIITMGLTAALAVAMVRWLGPRLKAYNMIVLPPFVTVIAGIIGREILPWSLKLTALIGQGVKQLTTLQPLLMGILIAIVFSILIMTPITSVGIAVAIGLAGIGSGAGNLGVCAAAFGFAILGWKVNSHGTSLAHFIGSPKMSMANVIKKPKIMLPVLCSAALCGVVAVLLGIKGTPMSAGFGFSGLVGPLGYFGIDGWGVATILKAIIAFLVAPVAFGLLFNWVFKKFGIVKDEDYFLEVQ